MKPSDSIRRDLSADLEAREEADLVAIGMRVRAERPRPSRGFRRSLLATLESPRGHLPAKRPTAPAFNRPLVLSYAFSGLLLLAVAGMGLVGVGPFSAG